MLLLPGLSRAILGMGVWPSENGYSGGGPVLLLGILGVALTIWSLWAGLGTYESNRARIFQGPVGTLVSLIVILIGVVLMVVGFF